ncbi:hypothetical protein [uncultured Microbacterium sp.]|uniref:hypothetical protein n=1 Tax=uncultured Microbacterium sp. TaxID=191216 RepID=UPI002601D488|nr:hypothetical protein [uncultured Microbacterium sp.]
MDLLSRFVERQRSPRSGLRPDLPSRYEPTPDSPSEAMLEVEGVVGSPRVDPTAAMPRHLVAGEPEAGPRPSHPAQRGAIRPEPLVPEPLAAEPLVAEPVRRRAPAIEAIPDSAPTARDRERAPAPSAPPRRARPSAEHPAAEASHDPTPTPHRGVRLEDTPPTADARALPEPLLPERVKPLELPGDRSTPRDAEGPRRPTVRISIGRVELRAPAAAPAPERTGLAAPRTAPRALPRPRLSLEDYLARAERGRP